MAYDAAFAASLVDVTWDDEIVPALADYIRIPNISPEYDPGWAAAGHMDRAVELVRGWLAGRSVAGMTVEVVRLEGRTPVILCEIPASDGADAQDTVLLYGHLDKQPPMDGWREGLAPFEPVLEGDLLYGRGGADDGYAAFASLTAIEALRAAGGTHARCVVLIEASEESGSPDLPAYVEHLADRIGTPSLVVCLDSWSPDDRRLWLTTSLRGLIQARLRVDVLHEGVHSGMAGGVVPSSFRILRHLLERVEDSATGRILLPEMQGAVPAERRAQAEAAVAAGVDPRTEAPWVTDPIDEDPVALVLANTWARVAVGHRRWAGRRRPRRPATSCGPHTEAALSLRLPPGVDAGPAAAALERALTADPPSGARVTLTAQSAETGWAAPPTAPGWPPPSTRRRPRPSARARATSGVGGSIPFMAMLGARFPDAQFVITGVLVPGSNAHGPNESLHIPTGKKVTAAVATVLAAHAAR